MYVVCNNNNLRTASAVERVFLSVFYSNGAPPRTDMCAACVSMCVFKWARVRTRPFFTYTYKAEERAKAFHLIYWNFGSGIIIYNPFVWKLSDKKLRHCCRMHSLFLPAHTAHAYKV